MTATFWAIVSAMTASILGLLLYPLLKRPAQTGSEREKTLPVYRQQFSELEQDRADGLLTDEQYQAARSELERRVLEETTTAESPAVATRTGIGVDVHAVDASAPSCMVCGRSLRFVCVGDVTTDAIVPADGALANVNDTARSTSSSGREAPARKLKLLRQCSSA